MRSILVFVLLSTILLRPQASEQEYVFEKISPETGFVFDAIHTICLDCNGMVWFGTNNGLYYYNSIEVQKVEFQLLNSDLIQTIDVTSVYKDESCRLWICTDKGLFLFSTEFNKCIQVELKIEPYHRNHNIQSILQVDENSFIISANKSLYLFSSLTGNIKTIVANDGFTKVNVSYIGKGVNDILLIGTTDGKVFESKADYEEINLLYASDPYSVTTICTNDEKYYIGFDGNGVELVDTNGIKLDEYKNGLKGQRNLPHDRVRQIIKRRNGDLWIGTYRGILVVSENSNETITSSEENGLPHSSIYVLYNDNNDGVWIGTWAGGVAYYSDFNYRFKSSSSIPYSNIESNSVISSFSETHDGNLLIGCDHAGLFTSSQTGDILNAMPLLYRKEAITKIKSLATENGKDIWIGTFDEGLWSYNILSKNLERLNSKLFREGLIISSQTIIDNELWIGTRAQGLFKYDIGSREFTKIDLASLYSNNQLHNKIWKTYKDSHQNLWVCTNDGFFVKSRNNDNFKRLQINNKDQNSDKIIVYTICEDHLGQMWLGTQGQGSYIYHPLKDTIVRFQQMEAIDESDVYSIVKDNNNDLWFATNQGLFRHSLGSGLSKYFTITDGLSGNLYNPNSAFVSSSGNLFFGTPNGYSVIDPSIVKENPIIPNVFLSKILINNSHIDDENSILLDSKHLAHVRSLEVKHNQNSLTFGFISSNYLKSFKNKFKYRLKNYQDEWAETDLLKDITFTKLPPGHYALEVFGTNNDGVQSKEPLIISIYVKPAIWQRWYAYVLYLLISIFIYYIIVRELVFRVKTRKEIVAERYKNEANDLIHTEKLKFFTNVSHEFRTPLTLIISPLNNLLAKFQSDPGTLNHLKIIMRNADRLLRLTNQMLDFRLLELGKIKLKASKTEIVDICKNVANCFELQIIEKQINFIFKSSFKSLYAQVDPDMIEKIVFNLVANAIKFSNEKDQVIVSVEKMVLNESDFEASVYTGKKFLGDSVSIRVQDRGIGMDSELLPKIFNRFSTAPDQKDSGTGIGLNICQEYARLNGANIIVHSRVNNGTSFTLNIPLTKTNEYVEENIIFQPQYDSGMPDLLQSEMPGPMSGKQPIVLLAEDNDDLRNYLKSYLSSRYKVLTAKNGKQAIEIAIEIIPDIIITDILMPGGDGMEVTKTLKGNQKTHHIPIIVLTALSEKDYQKESIIQGADAFLAKPIDSVTLLAQVENMLSSREILKEKFEHLNSEKTEVGKLIGESFLRDVERIIEKNMQNPQFDIIHLSKELNISRSSLHRKIRASSNQSITEFIRDIRLKNAIKLLKGDKYNMAEIGFFVGFNSTSYFIRSFKSKYGKTPKEYSKSL